MSEDANRLEFVTNRAVERTARLPFITWVVVVSSAIAVATAGILIFGVPLNALAWMVPLCIALFDLAVVPGRIRLPVGIWAPWVALVLTYLLFAEAEHAFQRTIMMLVPLVVGIATSKHAMPDEAVGRLHLAARVLAVSLVGGAVLKTSSSLGGGLPASTALAPEAMTSSALCTLLATSYAMGRTRDLIWWGLLAFFPIFGMTRMGMIATAVTLPLTLAPLGNKRRILFLGVIVAVGLAVFYSERFQNKMFVKKEGDLTDIITNSDNVATNGRRLMWDYLNIGISERPWFGHGANASEPLVAFVTHRETHPHNDWLRLRYDYGNIGAAVFALCMLAQLFHLRSRAPRLSPERRLLAYAGAFSFVPFALYMGTDNIILYASFFGNVQFTMIGLAYSVEPGQEAS